MISFIKGTIDSVLDNAVVLECNNIGYLIQASSATLAALSGKTEVKLHTLMLVREDGVSLVGFINREDLRMFELLTSVSGIGAKAALSLQSALSTPQIILAVLTDDVNSLSKAQGIGKKIAQRLALELKEKVKSAGGAAYAEITDSQKTLQTVNNAGPKQESIEALITLGYSRSDAVKTVLEVALEEMTTEQIIKAALKKLASF